MGRHRSSARWLREHQEDEYVRRAQREGYPSRAVYKLKEIQEKDRLLIPGMTVVDLGSAPGGWSQFAAGVIGKQGKVFAVDILPMDIPEGVEFIQGDFCEQTVLNRLLASIGGQTVDLVISDMAPNMSGIKAIDQPRGMYLVELAWDFARQYLRQGGDLLLKVFQGEGFEAIRGELRGSFASVVSRKPKSSRSRSAEIYLLARNYRL